MGKLFVASTFREVSDEQYAGAINDVMGPGRAATKQYRLCISFAHSTITTFRTVERRKLLAHHPFEEYGSLSSLEISRRISRSMKVECKDYYTKSIVLMRQFIRDNKREAEKKGSFYSNFKEYYKTTYPNGLSERAWRELQEKERVPVEQQVHIGRDGNSSEEDDLLNEDD